MSLFSVPHESERTPLDEINLQYVGPPVGWAGLWPHHGYKIALRIDGDEEAAHRPFLDLLVIVLPKLEEVESAADAYLRAFVGDAEGFYKGVWKLQSVRMQREPEYPGATGGKFEVTLSIGEDDYGEWGVGFIHDTYPSRAFRPYLFSRRQR